MAYALLCGTAPRNKEMKEIYTRHTLSYSSILPLCFYNGLKQASECTTHLLYISGIETAPCGTYDPAQRSHVQFSLPACHAGYPGYGSRGGIDWDLELASNLLTESSTRPGAQSSEYWHWCVLPCHPAGMFSCLAHCWNQSSTAISVSDVFAMPTH